MDRRLTWVTVGGADSGLDHPVLSGESDWRLTMPIWITEFGWSTGQTSQPAYYERAVSESQQATYLTQALEEFARFPQVRAAFWYTDVDHATPDPHQNGFGLMRTDGSRKPSYYSMKCAASGVCGPEAGS